MRELNYKNYIYGFINENRYIIEPMISGFLGLATFGVPGAIAGLSLSILEQFLFNYNYISYKYPTKIFVGLTAGYSVYPSYLTSLAGGIISITPAKYTLGIIDKYNISYPLIASLSGASYGGVRGALYGGAISTLDELLIYFNITNKHYLTYSSVAVTTCNTIFSKSLIVDSLSAGFGAWLANYEESVDVKLIPSNFAKDLYKGHANVLKPETIDKFTNEYVENIFTNQIITQKITLDMIKFQQSIIYQFEHIDANIGDGTKKFRTAAAHYVTCVVLISFSGLYFRLLQEYFQSRLYAELENDLKEVLFTNDNLLRITYNKSDHILVDNFQRDAEIIAYKGSEIISGSFFKIADSIHSLSFLVLNSPDILLYSIIYNQLSHYISSFLSTQISTLDSQIKMQESVISTYLKHDIQNIRVITERNGVNYSAKKLSFLYAELHQYQSLKNQLSLCFETYLGLSAMLDLVFNYYVTFSKVSNGKLEFEDRTQILYSSKRFFRVFTIKTKSMQDIEAVYKSIQRVELFLEKAANISQFSSNTCTDSVFRQFEQSETKDLLLSGLQITVSNQMLLNVDSLSLKFGQVYGLTGPSGSGKTSLVSEIAGVSTNGLCGKGIILYPFGTKVVTVSQEDYFPLNVTLQEAIFYPEEVNNSKIDEVVYLLEALKITKFELGQMEDWDSVLSGGQKKKILIISSLIKNPDILILDEAFNGLDKKSINEAQNLVKQKLKESLIISVDHNTYTNNQTGFYDHLLKVINETLIVKENIHDYDKLFTNNQNTDRLCMNDDFRSFIFGEEFTRLEE